MTNKPKAIGTAAETAVLKQIRPYFPNAARNALAGAADLGDIGHCGPFIFEVKGGKQTQQIGDGLLATWVGQALTEAENTRAAYGLVEEVYGILVTQRSGFGAPNARRWWVHIPLGMLAELSGGYYAPGRFAVARLELGDFLDLIADNGWVPGTEPAATTIEGASARDLRDLAMMGSVELDIDDVEHVELSR